MDIAFSTAARPEIVLEVGIAGQHGDRTQRRPAEVSMQDDTGGVYNAAQRGPLQVRERLLDAVSYRQPVWLARLDLATCVIEGTADFADNDRVREPGRGWRETFQNLVYGRQVAQQVAISHAFDGTRPAKK